MYQAWCEVLEDTSDMVSILTDLDSSYGASVMQYDQHDGVVWAA